MTQRLRALPWWLRVSLAAVAGFASAYGFAPTAWWPLLIVGLAILTTIAQTARTASQGAVTGLFFGFAFLLAGINWLAAIFVEAMLALVALESLFFALLGFVIRLVGTAPAWPVIVAGAWVATEFAYSRFPFTGFPWMRLGYAMVDSPLAGFFPFIGVAGVSFAVALLAQLLAHACLGAATNRARLVAGGVALSVFLLGYAGTSALTPPEATDSVRVGYVQGNAPGGGVYGLGVPRTITRNHVAETRRLAAAFESGRTPRPAFVIWPENGTDMDPFRDAVTAQLVRDALAAVDLPILVGTITEGPGPNERQTASVFWDPDRGVLARYNKRDIVPFGEWVPMRDVLEPLFPVVAYVGPQSVPGTGPGVLNVPVTTASGASGLAIGDLICFEVAYDSTVHETVTAGGQIIVVQSSNAMYTGTTQVPQQFAITRARAAELRREILVVTTTGTSGLIRPDGSVDFTLPEHTPASGTVVLPLRSNLTPAAAYGGLIDLATSAGALIAVIASVGLAMRRRRIAGSGAAEWMDAVPRPTGVDQ